MSRTHKTKPWRVRVMGKPTWLVEYHDHNNGVCDLPPRPTGQAEVWGSRQRGSCSWVGSRSFWACPANNCGCPSCNDQIGRKQQARRERHLGQRLARDWQVQ